MAVRDFQYELQLLVCLHGQFRLLSRLLPRLLPCLLLRLLPCLLRILSLPGQLATRLTLPQVRVLTLGGGDLALRQEPSVSVCL